VSTQAMLRAFAQGYDKAWEETGDVDKAVGAGLDLAEKLFSHRLHDRIDELTRLLEEEAYHRMSAECQRDRLKGLLNGEPSGSLAVRIVMTPDADSGVGEKT
jgi:hypothetical protein